MKASSYFAATDMSKSKTLSALRRANDGLQESERIHARFFSRSGCFALGALALAVGAPGAVPGR